MLFLKTFENIIPTSRLAEVYLSKCQTNVKTNINCQKKPPQQTWKTLLLPTRQYLVSCTNFSIISMYKTLKGFYLLSTKLQNKNALKINNLLRISIIKQN